MFSSIGARELGGASPAAFRRRAGSSVDLVKRLELQRLLEQHTGCVNTCSFSPDGELLVTGSDDRQIIIWDWEAGTVKNSYPSGHSLNVFQAKIMPFNASTLVTCGADGQVRVGQLSESGEVETRRLGRHAGRAHKLSIEPGSPHSFLSCGEDAVVKHFDLRTSKCSRLLSIRGVGEERGDDVGLNVVAHNKAHPVQFAAAGSDQFVRIYDLRALARGPCRLLSPRHLRGLRNRLRSRDMAHVTSVAYSSRGQLVATYNDEDIYNFAAEGAAGCEGSPVVAPASGSAEDALGSGGAAKRRKKLDLPPPRRAGASTSRAGRKAEGERGGAGAEAETAEEEAEGAAAEKAEGGDDENDERGAAGTSDDDDDDVDEEYETDGGMVRRPPRYVIASDTSESEDDEAERDEDDDSEGEDDEERGVAGASDDDDEGEEEEGGQRRGRGARQMDRDDDEDEDGEGPSESEDELGGWASGRRRRGTVRPEDEPMVTLPRGTSDGVLMRFQGHRNNQTVKGVNYLGLSDEFVVSGSDCGHVFIWSKDTGELQQMLEGDSHVVNVVENHPLQPMILATSGIDDDVKIWAPTRSGPQTPADMEAVARKNKKDRAGRPETIRLTPAMFLQLLQMQERIQQHRERRGGSGSGGGDDGGEGAGGGEGEEGGGGEDSDGGDDWMR